MGKVRGQSWHVRMTGGSVRLEHVGRRRRTWDQEPVEDDWGRVVGWQEVMVHKGGAVSGGAETMTVRSRRRMVRTFYGLPWERLARPVLIVLSYPGKWRRYVANDAEWGRHRDLLFKRWAREWGEPFAGVWGKEFQPRLLRPVEERGAPHTNLVCGLPAGVSAEDYEGLAARTRRMFVDYHEFGKRGAGEVWRAPEGEFAWSLRTVWAEIVTGNVHGDLTTRRHHIHGVTIRVRFDHGEGELENRLRMAMYVARDLGKEAQKTAPAGFGGVRQWWGYRGPGFAPEEESDWLLSDAVALRVRRRMIRWAALRVGGRKGWDAARAYREKMERYKQGVDPWDLRPEEFMAFLRWALAAERRTGRDAVVVDVKTGEVVA